jgi:hypothetical protein
MFTKHIVYFYMYKEISEFGNPTQISVSVLFT